LLREHEGRRTGNKHATVAEVLRFDAATRRAVVMSGWGRNADWFRNIEANDTAEITIGRQTFPVEHRLVDEQDATEVQSDYERRNRWLRPIVRRVISQIAGVGYDGSEQSRQPVLQRSRPPPSRRGHGRCP
jgi:deazaflavin-dependent oxidoreductase (nitroreductase family)